MLCCRFVMDNGDGTFKTKNYSPRCKMLTVGRIVDVTPAATCFQTALQQLGLTADIQDGTDAHGEICKIVKQHLECCPTCATHHTDPTSLCGTSRTGSSVTPSKG